MMANHYNARVFPSTIILAVASIAITLIAVSFFIDNISAQPADNPAGLLWPSGIIVDSISGIYVCDPGNHRVLYFPPGANPNNISSATRVYGQPDLVSNAANRGGTPTANTLNRPSRVAVSSDGVYVADGGNHRVLFYKGIDTTASRVYGQGGSFTSNDDNHGGLSALSLRFPTGVAVDGSDNLYIVDAHNYRVLFFPAGSTTPTRVYGQNGSFTTRLFPIPPTADSFFLPISITLSNNGVYVVERYNHRVLFFPGTSTTATFVYGQKDFGNGTAINPPDERSLKEPHAAALDGKCNLYIADTGNNRVLFYEAGSNIATRVYGQKNFTLASRDGLSSPAGVAISSDALIIADRGNSRIVKYRINDGNGGAECSRNLLSVPCRENYYFSATNQRCQRCGVAGTTTDHNEASSCSCSEGYAGESCDTCADNYHQSNDGRCIKTSFSVRSVSVSPCAGQSNDAGSKFDHRPIAFGCTAAPWITVSFDGSVPPTLPDGCVPTDVHRFDSDHEAVDTFPLNTSHPLRFFQSGPFFADRRQVNFISMTNGKPGWIHLMKIAASTCKGLTEDYFLYMHFLGRPVVDSINTLYCTSTRTPIVGSSSSFAYSLSRCYDGSQYINVFGKNLNHRTWLQGEPLPSSGETRSCHQMFHRENVNPPTWNSTTGSIISKSSVLYRMRPKDEGTVKIDSYAPYVAGSPCTIETDQGSSGSTVAVEWY